MKHCQECNLDFPDSYRFCGSCGGALSHSLTCHGCGELVESKWTFCTNCGRRLSPEVTTSEAIPSEAPEFREITAAASPAIPTSQTTPAPALEQRPGKVAPPEWYAAPDLFEDNDETTATPAPQDLVPRTTIAVPIPAAHPRSGNGKAPPTLTMLAAYGESGRTASPEWQRHHLLLVGLLLLVFFGVLGLGGWYWWTHRAAVAQSPPQAASTNAPAVADSSSSSASTASSAPTTSAPIATSGGAEEEWKRLRERRISAKPSESSAIIASLNEAEKKYPRDYRFAYEQAKLSIKGITSHHEAFGALALAGEKAIDNGKAHEMLDSLKADEDGDFYKLSRGHHEWQALEEALQNKDKAGLKALRH